MNMYPQGGSGGRDGQAIAEGGERTGVENRRRRRRRCRDWGGGVGAGGRDGGRGGEGGGGGRTLLEKGILCFIYIRVYVSPVEH